MAAGHPPHRLAEVTGLREITKHPKRPRDSQAAKLMIAVATRQRGSLHERCKALGNILER
jgi:hypothetical protein